MGWNFVAWLGQHRTEVESQWLALVQELPAYVTLPADECLSCLAPLVDDLFADHSATPEESAAHWAVREMTERGATPSELLAVAEGLSRTIRGLLPADADRRQVNGRVDALSSALAHHFAGQVERLATEKRQLEALLDVTRDLTAGLEFGRILDKTLVAVMPVVNAQMGAVLLLGGDGRRVVPQSTVNWSGEPISLDELPAAWRLGQADSLLVLDDLPSEPTDAWVATLAGSDARSLMAAPLVANGEFMGLLAMASSSPGAFDENHVRLFRTVIGQIDVTMGNAEVCRLTTEQALELGQMLRHQQEEASKAQAILTSIVDGVVVNDAEGETILVNPAAERILSQPAAELLGQNFHAPLAAFDDQGRDEAIDSMETLLEASVAGVKKVFKMNLQVEGHIIYAQLSPVLAQQGDFLGVVTVFRDITKEVESDRAKSEFVSNVSHELRTPMTAIKGYTDLLHAGSVGPINDEQERFLSIIKNNADRLTALINDLLDISRVDTGRVRFVPRPVQISDVISDVVNVLACQAQSKEQMLTYEVVGGLPDLMGDRDRLNQVLTNLVSNAIRYTPRGGEIEVQAYPVDGAVRVDVRDTGIGIAPEDLGRIFERFYRAEHPLVREAGGSGLGLSIAKMFVEMHGGRLWVESEEDKGSTFTLILPMPVQAEGDGRRLPPRLMSRTRTILIVEDEPDIAQLIQRQLEDSGYRVSVLGSGPAVVTMVEETKPDLVILDLILPEVDGLDVLRALKENMATADVPVVILTVMPDDGSAWKLGIVDYLTKPVTNEDLLRSVEKALTWQGRVLIVDDDADTVGLLSAAMRQIGFTPLVAADGYEALALARRHRPDLILLDLRLPGMDGYEAVTHLKRDAVTQTIPIVAISAHAANAEEERKRLVALGAVSFLPKPFSISELLDEIEVALKPTGPAPAS